MFKSNEGIILEDCLISFILLSTFLLLMSSYLTEVYNLKRELQMAHEQINNLKLCALSSCEKSMGNNVTEVCESISIKKRNYELCIEI